MKRLPELLYRIKNGYKNHLSVVKSNYYSGWNVLLTFLYQEGFIQNFKVLDFKKVYIYLRYHQGKSSIRLIKNFNKSSKPLYLSKKDLWKFSKQGGLLLLSTSQGILSSEECLRIGLGGKLLFYIS